MPPASSRRAARRGFCAGLLGSGLLKGLGAMSLAPAILTREADAGPQLAQGRSGMTEGSASIELKDLPAWTLDQTPMTVKFSSDSKSVGVRFPLALDVYDCPSGRRITRIGMQADNIRRNFGFGPNGSAILVGPGRRGSGDREIARIIDINDPGAPISVQAPESDRRISLFTRDVFTSADGMFGLILTSASPGESAIFIVDMITFKVKKIILQENHQRFFMMPVAISNQGLVAVCQFNGQRYWEPSRLCIYDGKTGELQQVLEGNRPGISSIAWAGDGLSLATGGLQPNISPALQDDKERASVLWGETTGVWLWSAPTWRRHLSFVVPTLPVESLGLSKHAEFLAAIHGRDDKRLGGAISVFDLKNRKIIYARQTNIEDISSGCQISNNDRYIGWLEGSKFRLLEVRT